MIRLLKIGLIICAVLMVGWVRGQGCTPPAKLKLTTNPPMLQTPKELSCKSNFDFGIHTIPGGCVGEQVTAKIILSPDVSDSINVYYWQEVYDEEKYDGELKFNDSIALFDPDAALVGGFQLRDTSSYFRIENNGKYKGNLPLLSKLCTMI